MINAKNYLVLGTVTIAVLTGIYFFVNPQKAQNQTVTSEAQISLTQTTRVDYTDSGFLPKDLTVKAGTAVTWTNSSGKSMWVASAPHPAHTDLADFDQLGGSAKGTTYSYTFLKVGTWKYHNHLSPKDGGEVVIE